MCPGKPLGACRRFPGAVPLGAKKCGLGSCFCPAQTLRLLCLLALLLIILEHPRWDVIFSLAYCRWHIAAEHDTG